MLKGALCFFTITCLAAAAEVPAGTQIHVRLTSAINSKTAKSKDPVTALVIAPVMSRSQVVVPAGSVLTGHVTESKAPDATHQQAILGLEFDHISPPGIHSGVEPAQVAHTEERPGEEHIAEGHNTYVPALPGRTVPGQQKISARVVSIENARETVDEQGRILGIIAGETASARLDQGINKVAQRFPGLADVLGAAKQIAVSEADPSISYGPGVEMTVTLTKPLNWNEQAELPSVAAISPADALVTLVNREPFRTQAQSGRPSDLTNLMFLGSREQIEAAFQQAGWSSAEKLNGKSKYETFRAIVEMRGYKEAPVSLLLLDGRAPDLVFQKQNNTFAQRHHLRIWETGLRFDGREVWVCAATHDIGIDFSDRDYTFIHRIDPHIDDERAKVVNDLLFTGAVHALALVERPEVPSNARNATGDELITDKRMAVLEF